MSDDPDLAERPAEPDPGFEGGMNPLPPAGRCQACGEVVRLVLARHGREDHYDPGCVGSGTKQWEHPHALAERPDDPDGGRWFADRVDVYETMPCGCRGDQPSHTCTLAERPAEPEPGLDLVAAFDAAHVVRSEHAWKTPSASEAMRMAAVAQARIDAAVNAERRRILGGLHELRTEARTVTKRDAFRDAIAVVGRDTGGQR